MIDQFNAVYKVMAVEIPNTKDAPGRRAFTPGEVDEMDLSTIAALLGVGDETPDEKAQADFAEIARRRAAGEKVSWDDIT